MVDQQLSDKICKALPSIDGWCSLEKAHKLAELVVSFMPQVVVEIGVYGGKSLIPMALALQHINSGKVYGIDPWSAKACLEDMEEAASIEWWGHKAALDEMYRRSKNWVMHHHLVKHAELIRDKAENVVDRFENDSIGILHIDGNHSEALCYKDVTLYLPKVCKNGYIVLDDIYWAENGKFTITKSIEYLNEHGCKELETVGDCLVMQKL